MPSTSSNPCGAATTATREPSRIPNFRGSGVPEYPLLSVAMPCSRPSASAPSSAPSRPQIHRADGDLSTASGPEIFLTISLAFRRSNH